MRTDLFMRNTTLHFCMNRGGVVDKQRHGVLLTLARQCFATWAKWLLPTRHVKVLNDHEAGPAESPSAGDAPAPADPLGPI